MLNADVRGRVNYQDIYKRIDDALGRRHVTASKMCADLKISASTMYDWKRGRFNPRLDTIAIMADYLHMPIQYAVYGEPIQLEDIDYTNKEEHDLMKTFRSLPEELQRSIQYFASSIETAYKMGLHDALKEEK